MKQFHKKLLVVACLTLGLSATALADRVGNGDGDLAFTKSDLPKTDNFHRLIAAWHQGVVPDRELMGKITNETSEAPNGRWYYGTKPSEFYPVVATFKLGASDSLLIEDDILVFVMKGFTMNKESNSQSAYEMSNQLVQMDDLGGVTLGPETSTKVLIQTTLLSNKSRKVNVHILLDSINTLQLIAHATQFLVRQMNM